MRVIDLFCGCGGMSLGFMQAGYDVLAAFDIWQPALETYRRNFSHPVIQYDLGSYESSCAVFKQFSPQMIIGGPPCQDFSSAGKRDESLGRADLTISFAEIISIVKPTWFVMENVDRAIKSKTWEKAIHTLNAAGYGLSQIILDASLCGVPQQRKRLFLIGELGGESGALLPYLRQSLNSTPMTVRDYLGSSLDIQYYYRHPRSYKRRAIFSIDEPSPTIRGVNRPVPQGYKGHESDPVAVSPQIRPLTTHERSLVQTFPAKFQFCGTKSEIEQLIGNAVPVKLAEYVAKCINGYLSDKQQCKMSNLSVPLQLSLNLF